MEARIENIVSSFLPTFFVFLTHVNILLSLTFTIEKFVLDTHLVIMHVQHDGKKVLRRKLDSREVFFLFPFITKIR